MTALGHHICPICLKELQVDNVGLNEHIDFCLSKDSIKQAIEVSLPSSSAKRKAVEQDDKAQQDERWRKPKTHSGSKPRGKPVKTGSQKGPFRLSQSDFGKAGFTKL
jgi:hypothetical protein